MNKSGISMILDSIGGKSLYISLGCRISVDENRELITLSHIKTSRKCVCIVIKKIQENALISFYKSKSKNIILDNEILCPTLDSRKIIADYLNIDI